MNCKTVQTLLIVADVLAMLIASVIALVLAPWVCEILLGQPVDPVHSMMDGLSKFRISYLLAGIILFLIYNRGHYVQRVPWWGQVQYLVHTFLLAMVVSAFFYYAIKDHFSRVAVVLFWGQSFFYVLVARKIAKIISHRFGIWDIHAVIIGDKRNTLETLYTLSSEQSTGYVVDTVLLRDKTNVTLEAHELPTNCHPIPVRTGQDGNVEQFIRENTDKFYIIALDTFRGTERDKMVKLMQELHIDFVIVLPVKRISLYGMEPHFFFGHDTMFLRQRREIESPLGKLTKRAFDFSMSLIALIILSPLMLFVCMVIKKEGGSIFFGHVRVGYHGRRFKCWKFRSMRMDAAEVLKELLETNEEARKEWEKDFKLKNDPRITPIGNFLRKTSLDELPQLFNVLKGEMSLVGPRPIVEKEQAYYGENLEYYLSVKPGITGLWQASGRNDTSYEQRVLYDSWYVRNWSLWNDIVILFKTVSALVFSRGAY